MKSVMIGIISAFVFTACSTKAESNRHLHTMDTLTYELESKTH